MDFIFVYLFLSWVVDTRIFIILFYERIMHHANEFCVCTHEKYWFCIFFFCLFFSPLLKAPFLKGSSSFLISALPFINFCFCKGFDISHLYFIMNFSQHITSFRSNFPLASDTCDCWTQLVLALPWLLCSLQHDNSFGGSAVDFTVIQHGRTFGFRRTFNSLIFFDQTKCYPYQEKEPRLQANQEAHYQKLNVKAEGEWREEREERG